MSGTVYLIGAGPGDPELITQKGVRVLKEAEVVLYDYLIHPNVLTYCQDKAKLICVGKEKGRHSQTQDQINKKLVEYAQKYKKIVRLKGGDPMIFGRAGEELTVLKKHKINHEIIPGISSALSVPTYAGIPLTHRDHSHSVAIVTGTGKDSKTPKVFPKADTLVFLMAVTHLKEIVEKLCKEGLSKKTKAALIEKGTLSAQKKVIGTLETIVSLKEKHALSHPAILVVGEVVSFSNEFSFIEKKPLYQKRIWVLRQKDQTSELAEQLSELGAEVLILPMIQTQLIKSSGKKIIEALPKATQIIFTSPNAVRHFKEALIKNKKDLRAIKSALVVSIGKKTTKALEENGLLPDKEAKKAHQEGVLDDLPKELHSETILLPQSKQARPFLKEQLEKRGAIVTAIPLYETKKTKKPMIQVKKDDIVVFTSASTVENFFEGVTGEKAEAKAIVIGPTTKKEYEKYSKNKVWMSKESSLESIVSCILSHHGKTILK